MSQEENQQIIQEEPQQNIIQTEEIIQNEVNVEQQSREPIQEENQEIIIEEPQQNENIQIAALAEDKVEQEPIIEQKQENQLEKMVLMALQDLKGTVSDLSLKLEKCERTIMLQDKIITDMSFDLKKTTMKADMMENIICKQIQDGMAEQRKQEEEAQKKLSQHIIFNQSKQEKQVNNAIVNPDIPKFENAFSGQELSLSQVQVQEDRPLTKEEIRAKRAERFETDGSLQKTNSGQNNAVDKFMKDRKLIEQQRTEERLVSAGFKKTDNMSLTYKK